MVNKLVSPCENPKMASSKDRVFFAGSAGGWGAAFSGIGQNDAKG